jgi:hypothetical protein
MHDGGRRTARCGWVLGVGFLAGAALVGLAAPGLAKVKPANECLAKFTNVPAANFDGGTFKCSECDPACDMDAVATANQSCTFKIRVCADALDPTGTCQAATLKKVKVKSKCGSATLTPSGTSSVCGAFTGTVKTKKKGRNRFRAGKCKVTIMALANGRPKRLDSDKLVLECDPQAAATCPTTTTTTTSSTTTTLKPVCGNGILEPGEVCDTPCAAGGQCTGGMVCNHDCSGCITPGPCGATCGATAPTRMSFTTTPPSVGTGTCGTSDGIVTGMVLDNGGATVCNLRSGGLYFGGSGDAVPLPAAVPDLGTSVTKIACCQQDGVTMEIIATKDTDIATPKPNRTCTAGGVTNPEYPKACAGGSTNGAPCTSDAQCAPGVCFSHDGCLFGPPLPIPNAMGPALSTCVINRVAKNAAGTASCSTGATSLDLPLISDLYLTGDFLDGSAPDRPAIAGIQPCPLCTKICAGGANVGLPCTVNGDCPASTCGAAAQCLGGPNNNMPCTPGSTALGAAYPTSHDCIPPPATFIGPLDIPFALTTGTTQKVSVDLPAQDRVFCGFCGGGVAFRNPATPCATNADCAGFLGCGGATLPCGTCKQRQPGAFQVGDARTITETGSPAGPLTDQLTHASTLVSVFCIPPSFNGAVDGTADLPGPGAVSLPGVTQIQP